MEVLAECFAVFHKGGPVMYLILLCSLTVTVIGVERYLYFKSVKTDDNFIEKLTFAIEGHDWDAAQKLCDRAGGIVAEVARKGIYNFERDVYHIESILEGEASLAVSGLKENLNHLSSIVTMAPLLGLLGTVVGMISSFSVMNVKAGQPLAITNGVGEALIATASGLCVAIFAMVVYSYFNHRLERIINQVERICILIIEQVGREQGYEIA